MLLAGCSTTHELTAAGQQKFTDSKPAAECQLLVTGTQSNWLSGNGGEGSSMRGAANDLRNKAAAMGGNVIYGANSRARICSPASHRWTAKWSAGLQVPVRR